MSSNRPSEGSVSFSGPVRWAAYLLIGLALLAVFARAATRTVSLAQSAATLTPTAAATAEAGPPAVGPPAPTATIAGVYVAPTQAEPTATPDAGATATAANAGLSAHGREYCGLYHHVAPDLLIHVDRNTAVTRDFEPSDLAEVPLDPRNQAFRPVRLRQVVHQPLLDMLEAMGSNVWVMSGYRSYSEQQLAYDKWQQLYPDRAPDISAVPGHSEHQLGTAVDFTAPYMDERFGDFFNIKFSEMPEGVWLLKHAAYYGFTLSYPEWGTAETGYAWEPWHFRYVGLLATELLARRITLTRFLQECQPG